MTTCQECGKPWGNILKRGEPEPDAATLLVGRAVLIEELWEQWECDYEPAELEAVDRERLPPVRAARIVYISEATARFAEEHGIGEAYLEDCWQEVRYVDLPAWLLKGRKQRWAVLWDCCDIGNPSLYGRELVRQVREEGT